AAGDRGRRPRGAGRAGRTRVPALGVGPCRRHRAGPGAGATGRARAPWFARLSLAAGPHRIHPVAADGRGGGGGMSKARIWIVDDDRSVRFVLATALRDAGYEVEQFEGSAAALQALARVDAAGLPSLLFTDVRMPGDDGLVLLERLKTRMSGLPVI